LLPKEVETAVDKVRDFTQKLDFKLLFLLQAVQLDLVEIFVRRALRANKVTASTA
jgi:hypothetical protein